MTDNGISEISPDALMQMLERGEDVQVLDVRAPQRLESGRIENLPDDRFFNITGSELMASGDPFGVRAH